VLEERAKRKLSAILSADVKGYSRLMGDDELATVRTLEVYREMIAEIIRNYRGRVVDSPGDNVLAEFGSVVDAVESAVEIQKELKSKNAELLEDRRMEFRIGINLGDVIEEGERIYGDGVNIAARIESLAKAGGICISRNVYEQVKNKLKLGYEYLGEHTVKNIEEPIQAYRILMESNLDVPRKGEGLQLPEKPSIAVLPFDNLSGDPEQEYFSDGMTEEMITALSKVPKMFVIARNSTFTYKGKPVKVQQVGEELGVKYVLEGSVRKAGTRIRITAQLVDTANGHHLWAERYERDLKDIFALQDEITYKILTALQVTLTEGEQAQVWATRTDNLDAFLKYLQARRYFGLFTEEGYAFARQLAQEAINLDKKYTDPYVLIAWSHWSDGRFGWSESRSESFKQAYLAAQQALALDDAHPGVHILLGGLYLYQRDYEKAIAEGQKAIALGPNDAEIHAIMAHILRFAGRFEEAIALVQKALRLQPSYTSWYLGELAMCYYYVGRHEEAIKLAEEFFKLALSRGEKFISYYYYAIAAMNYIRLGRDQEAREAAAQITSLFPGYSLEWDRQFSVYKYPEHLERQHEEKIEDACGSLSKNL
jgi:adenylate cyclase